MTISLALCLAWVLGAAVTAMLPAERQYGPGFVLLLAAPLILTPTASAPRRWWPRRCSAIRWST